MRAEAHISHAITRVGPIEFISSWPSAFASTLTGESVADARKLTLWQASVRPRQCQSLFESIGGPAFNRSFVFPKANACCGNRGSKRQSDCGLDANTSQPAFNVQHPDILFYSVCKVSDKRLEDGRVDVLLGLVGPPG